MKNFFGTPLIVSQHGQGLDNLTWYIHWLMFVLFIGWAIYFLYVLFRFRRTRNPQADHLGVQSHFSTYVEVGVAVTEAVLLIGFAVPLWAKSVEKFPPEKSSLVIRVTGRQFNWLARYPGTNAVFGKQDVKFVAGANPLGLDVNDPLGKDDRKSEGSSEIAVPIGTNVIMHISSMDVIHSFKVFPLRVNQDAIPGMSVPIHFVATKVGDYAINCAQLCGVGHSLMKGTLKVMEPAAYEEWVNKLPLAASAGGSEFE